MWLTRLFRKKNTSTPLVAAEPLVAADPTEFLTMALVRLLEAHGLDCQRHEDWIAPNGQLPAMRGHWSPREKAGRLDIEVAIDADTVIQESFAGMVTTHSADPLHDALDNFTINSFHVLLSALWRRDDPEQVTNETWQIGDTSFAVCIGNFGQRGSTSEPPNPPDGLFQAVELAIRTTPLTPRLHWFRFYVGQFKDNAIFEALHDNEPWPAGVETLKALKWPPTVDFYSVRLFLMMKPVAPAD